MFFGADGTKRTDSGFDAVVGNPPWLRFQRIATTQREYQRNRYHSAAEKYDIYGPFIEQSLSKIHKNGLLGFIVQNRFLSSGYGESLREVITNEANVRRLLDFEDAPIFQGTTTYPLITILQKQERETFGYSHLYDADIPAVQAVLEADEAGNNEINSSHLDPSSAWIFPSAAERDTIESIRNAAETTFGEKIEISKSVSTNFKEAFLFESGSTTSNVEQDLLVPAVDGKDIQKYSAVITGKQLLFPYRWTDEGPSLVDISRYPNAEEHLREYEEELRGRRYYNKTLEEAGLEWYEYPHVKENHNQPKILFPDISTEPRCTFDAEGEVLTLTTAYGGVRTDTSIDVRYLSAIFNSAPVSLVFEQTSPQMSGGYYRYQPQYIGALPLRLPNTPDSITIRELDERLTDSDFEIDELSESDCYEYLISAAEVSREFKKNINNLNLSLYDHLGSYSDGQTLADIGLTQPPKGSADSILQHTTEEKPNLRVGEATVVRESDSTVEIRLTARYKPDDEDAYETDQWGYTETDPLPALRITDLSETQVNLIEAFVPVAVDEAGGFADFRETATKTNSLVDRLRKLTLPAVDEVRDGLESYIETKERADELEKKIERTDELIDEIVYELYGLTDEEIEIVEEAVGDN